VIACTSAADSCIASARPEFATIAAAVDAAAAPSLTIFMRVILSATDEFRSPA
jgi:hypothetical protein